MPLLIDGHNLIGQMPDLSLSDPDDENQLIAQLRELASKTHKHITVVFDPNPSDNAPQIGYGKSSHGLLTIIFASPGRKADDVIRHMVSDTRDKQGLLVVTSDAAVADFSHRCGIRVQKSAEFNRWMKAQLSGKPTFEAKPIGSSQEVVNWSDVFKEPPPDLKSTRLRKTENLPKGKKRSDQLKQQVKRIRNLF